MKRTLPLLVVSATLLVGVACTSQESKTQAARLTDSDVENTVKNRIKTNPSLSDADVDVDADVDDKTLTLSGTVYSEMARREIVEIAGSVQPGFTITDKIDVKPGDIPRDKYTEKMAESARESARSTGEKIGESISDAWIHTKISTKLATNDTTPARKINVDVENNVVTLRGEVESIEVSREAERVASSTEGVSRVRNLLKVKR